MTGRVGYLAGAAAEDSVARDYERRGYGVVARRWRGSGGEIDIVLRDRDDFVFVEVKKSRSFARAAERLSAAQLGRICRTATEFLAGIPGGMGAGMRFDLAMVDGAGRMQTVENITL
ncbi:YraN family protein [Maritimibacter sp. DP1N21-5]|uniref:YraN family protein n=1 Tax=Maritimibacter sp. DP1N21-5 TaxID=2836867 RepID=UPI001C476901|nr:YraN family protein [Maritimibacter sp. DP1N21-5]MBV7408583.1 YraN family protein [Maritimibacter sp. DP1N21-5]